MYFHVLYADILPAPPFLLSPLSFCRHLPPLGCRYFPDISASPIYPAPYVSDVFLHNYYIPVSHSFLPSSFSLPFKHPKLPRPPTPPSPIARLPHPVQVLAVVSGPLRGGASLSPSLPSIVSLRAREKGADEKKEDTSRIVQYSTVRCVCTCIKRVSYFSFPCTPRPFTAIPLQRNSKNPRLGWSECVNNKLYQP